MSRSGFQARRVLCRACGKETLFKNRYAHLAGKKHPHVADPSTVFDEHLWSCTVCREELDSLRRAAVALAYAVPATRVARRSVVSRAHSAAGRPPRSHDRRFRSRVPWPPVMCVTAVPAGTTSSYPATASR